MGSVRGGVRRLWHSLPARYRQRLMVTSLARFAYRNAWAPPGHFYSPYPDVRWVRTRERALFEGSGRLPGVDLRPEAQLELLARLVSRHDVREIPELEGDPSWRYHLSNVPFGYADGLAAALLLRELTPRRYVEIGSGWSSMLVLDLADRYFASSFRPTFVDPYPDARLLDGDGSFDLHQVAVQDAPMSLFRELRAGDVLFVDSTHVAKVGSDVNFLLFEVLPTLAPGVIVHFHDIHWPFEYPKEWVYEGRAWNECYLLRAFLCMNDSFEILLWPSFLVETQRAWFLDALPLALRNPGGSLWLRRGPAAERTADAAPS